MFRAWSTILTLPYRLGMLRDFGEEPVVLNDILRQSSNRQEFIFSIHGDTFRQRGGTPVRNLSQYIIRAFSRGTPTVNLCPDRAVGSVRWKSSNIKETCHVTF